MSTSTDLHDPADAVAARARLVDDLVSSHLAIPPRVAETMRRVPRHRFVPDASIADAYADDTVALKRDKDGTMLSCASAPSIVATMLAQADVVPGARILEAGAATGYNAALLADLTGPAGRVTTIEVDPELAPVARARLDRTGHERVEVIEGDAALGWAPNAPYDLIIATVGVHDLPHVWLEQLAPGGRLVVPMRLRGSVTRSITWQNRDGVWSSANSAMCGFVPLRGGIADDPRRKIDLTGDRSAQLHLHQNQDDDPAGLRGVLDRPSHEMWTGVIFRPMVSFEWMYLWSTLTLPHGLSSLDTTTDAIDAGLVRPAFKASCMAAVIDDGLAYMTMRRFPDPDDPAVSLAEIGVIGHGPNPAAAVERYADAIRGWAATAPGHEAVFTLHPGGASDLQPDDRIR